MQLISYPLIYMHVIIHFQVYSLNLNCTCLYSPFHGIRRLTTCLNYHGLKVFRWRACHNALPTGQNLLKRRVLEVATCELCTLISEDCIYALWECGVAQGIWAGSLVGVQKIASQQAMHPFYIW